MLWIEGKKRGELTTFPAPSKTCAMVYYSGQLYKQSALKEYAESGFALRNTEDLQ